MKTNNNFTILVVDDEAFNIELVKIYLLEEGYKVLTALDAQGAVEAVKSHTVNLILLDINMPKVDGFRVCKILKDNQKTKDIPIIFLTAQVDVAYISKAFEVGGVDYIIKPFNAIELKARVKTHLENVAYLEEIKHKQFKLAQLSITDAFTKLSNSLYFDTILKQKTVKKESFWFIYIKINRFEKINALYGYYRANKIIRTFAKLLQELAPKGAIVAKLHGVSFAIVMKNYDIQVMKNFYMDLKKGIKEHKQLSTTLHISIVFQDVKANGETPEELYNRAQQGVEKLQERSENYLFL